MDERNEEFKEKKLLFILLRKYTNIRYDKITRRESQY